MFNKVTAIVSELNQLTKSINRLEFKDFEDLKFNITHFGNLVGELDKHLSKIYEDTIEAIEDMDSELSQEQEDILDRYNELKDDLDRLENEYDYFTN